MNLNKFFIVLSLGMLLGACSDGDNVSSADDGISGSSISCEEDDDDCDESSSSVESSSSSKKSKSSSSSKKSKSSSSVAESSGDSKTSSGSTVESSSNSKTSSSSAKSSSGTAKSSDSSKNSSSGTVSSSSSVAISSSSQMLSSSSFVLPEGWSWDVPESARLNPKIKYGTLVDNRDGRKYKTVKIAPEWDDYSQEWMAENLKYSDSVRTPSLKGRNACYRDSVKYCEISGRYYSWLAAIDYMKLAEDPSNPLDCSREKTCGINNQKVQGICPEGWHLPTKEEWATLIATLGSSSVAGKHLKALTGWDKKSGDDNNGDDAHGFSALPTGKFLTSGEFDRAGSDVYYWSSYESDERNAIYMNINNIFTQTYFAGRDKSEKLTIRCAKDQLNSSSSSVPLRYWSWDVPKERRFNSNISYGTMIDSRDNREYKTVTIAPAGKYYSRVWMAENLNYADSVKTPVLKGRSWCYNDSAKYCDVGGRYYTWAAAIDSVALLTDSKNPMICGDNMNCGLDFQVQGICPDGWHLPTVQEWNGLFEAVGGVEVAGEVLKARNGWNSREYESANGSDSYGFSALPVGSRAENGKFVMVGAQGDYWASNEEDDRNAKIMDLNHFSSRIYVNNDYKSTGNPVRCVKGKPFVPSSSSSLVTSERWSWDIPKEDYFNSNIDYDTMIDPRDNQVYKIVNVAEGTGYSQVWMAENLNYADSVKTPSLKGRSWCYNDSTKYCKVGGRYYTWAAAIDSVALATDKGNPMDCGFNRGCKFNRKIQGICPSGWHLPSKDEWGALIVALGNSGVAGKHLKALTGWGGNSQGRGIDTYGFTALPVGRRAYGDKFLMVGDNVYFWSSTEYSITLGYYMNLNDVYTKAYISQDDKTFGISVRCVKD